MKTDCFDIKKAYKLIFIFFIFIFSLISLSSCTSVNKIRENENFTYKCNYDSETNKTEIVWRSKITNKSIYDIDAFWFRFELYDGDTYIDKVGYTWDLDIKHGDFNDTYRVFYRDGKITDISINEWGADYLSLWDTYHTWFITTIVIVSIVSIVMMLFLLLGHSEEISYILTDYGYAILGIVPTILISIVGLISWVSSNWVPICIVGGGVAATVIIVGLIALIEFIADEFFDIETKYIGIFVLTLTLIALFIFGCIFWKWWAMLLIYIGIVTFTIGIYLSAKKIQDFVRKKKGNDSEEDEESKEDNSNVEDENNQQVKKQIKTFKSNISFDDIAGLESAKQAFKEKVILPFEHPELYEKFGKKAGGGILLYGPPGTGKTMFAEATSNELNATFIPVKCSDIKSKWYGESEQNIKNIFAKARRSKRSIIFFDEFEAIGAKRTDNSENGNNDLVPEILALMQGVGTSNSKNTILIIAATNKPWAIDSAFMRPGRFDNKILIPLPDYEARKYLFKRQLSKLPIADDLDFDYLAKITDGFNGADIKEVCEELKMSAINDSINKGIEQTIGMDDVKKIEKTIKSSVQLEDIVKLEEFESSI